jgi:hypothetical protein
MASKMPPALMAKFKGKETGKEEKAEKKMPPAMYKKGEKMEESKMKKAGKPMMKGKY